MLVMLRWAAKSCGNRERDRLPKGREDISKFSLDTSMRELAVYPSIASVNP
jgi:hypothetical protein